MPEPLYKYLGKRSAKVEKISEQMTAYEKVFPQYAGRNIMLTDDAIGIEIEIENIKRHGPNEYPVWQVKQDGSLRNNGFEYVSVPISGWRVPYAINQFFDTVSPDYHFSPRTSIHVHLNALDMYPLQLAGFIIVYLIFEPLLYRFVGQDRDKNNFCVPMLDTDIKLLHWFTGSTFVPPQLAHNRYLGLNIDAIRKYGTFEFRQLGGTDDKERIFNWINLILSIKKMAMGHEYERLLARIEELNTNSAYYAFFSEVFGNYAPCLEWGNLQKDMEGPVSRIKRLGLKNDYWRTILNGVTRDDYWYGRLMKSVQTAKPADFVFQADVPGPARRAAARPRINWDVDVLARQMRAAGAVVRPEEQEPVAELEVGDLDDGADFDDEGEGE